MKHLLIISTFAFLCSSLKAQNVGIGTKDPDKSAALDITSDSTGLLIPRMTSDERTQIINPATGLLVYDLKTDSYWYWTSSAWVEIPNTTYSDGLKSVNGGAFTQYTINRKRYIWELGSTFPTQTSTPISNTILKDLCADADGCRVTLGMTNWDGSTQAVASKTFVLFIGANNQWRTDEANGPTSGTDGNNAIEHAGILLNMVYFTDGSYPSSTGTDAAVGMSLLKWVTFPSAVCRLIIED